MRSSNKKVYIVLIIVALIGITIGYAVINTTLNINGKSNISKNTWDVYFDNVIVNAGSVEAVEIPTVSSKTTVDFEVGLNLPGDYYEFTVDVVNDGTIDAMIESIEKFPELSEEQAKYLNYTVTYENGEAITTKQLVKKEEFVRLKVRVELRKDIDPSDLPEVGDVLYLRFTVNYQQADNNGVSVIDNGVNKFITFTVEGKTYNADSGMGWEAFVASDYNVDNFFVSPMTSTINTENCISLYYNDTYVFSNSSIVPNGNYILMGLPC